jgi:hypothetical protein
MRKQAPRGAPRGYADLFAAPPDREDREALFDALNRELLGGLAPPLDIRRWTVVFGSYREGDALLFTVILPRLKRVVGIFATG